MKNTTEKIKDTENIACLQMTAYTVSTYLSLVWLCVRVYALDPYPREASKHCGCDHTEGRAFPVALLEPSTGGMLISGE